MVCDRCGKPATTFKTSYLSTETICKECEEAEKHLPFYEFGKKIELQHVKDGDLNFRGILDGVKYSKDPEANVIVRIKYGDTSQNIYDAWDDLINNILFNAHSFATIMRENGIDYVEEAKSWLRYMATTTNVDGRNQIAQNACIKLGADKFVVSETDLTKLMARNHKTLQQTFTSVMISYYEQETNMVPLTGNLPLI